MTYNLYWMTLLLDLMSLCLSLFLIYNYKVFKTSKGVDILFIQTRIVFLACLVETGLVIGSIYWVRYEGVLDTIELFAVCIHLFLYISFFEYFYNCISFWPDLSKKTVVFSLVGILLFSLGSGWVISGANEKFLNHTLSVIDATESIYVAEYILVSLLALMAIAAIVAGKRQKRDSIVKTSISALSIIAFYFLVDQLMMWLIPLDKYRSNAFQFSLTYTFVFTIINTNQMVEKRSKEVSIQAELDMARSIQLDALTKKQPAFEKFPEIQLVARMDTAKEVGGDFYDYFELDNENAIFLIADVSGKGVPAALFMMTAKNTIKAVARGVVNPAEIMTRANEILTENNDNMMFVTVWLGIYNTNTHELTYTNAGHNLPMLLSEDGKVKQLTEIHGVVVGVDSTCKYAFSTISISRGDRLFLFTDGLTEAHNSNNDLFGEGTVIEILRSNSKSENGELLQLMKDSVCNFSGDTPQFDDITMMMIDFELQETITAEGMQNFIDGL